MRAEKRNYVLVGYGRWGSSIPTLGVPVQWSDISEARAIVECFRGPERCSALDCRAAGNRGVPDPIGGFQASPCHGAGRKRIRFC